MSEDVVGKVIEVYIERLNHEETSGFKMTDLTVSDQNRL